MSGPLTHVLGAVDRVAGEERRRQLEKSVDSLARSASLSDPFCCQKRSLTRGFCLSSRSGLEVVGKVYEMISEDRFPSLCYLFEVGVQKLNRVL